VVSLAEQMMVSFLQKKTTKLVKAKEAVVEARLDEEQDDAVGEMFTTSKEDAFVSSYRKQAKESSGVMAMMDMLKQDVEKEIGEAKVEEEDSQADYEQMMKNAKDKRAADAKTITEKEGVKSELETLLAQEKAKKVSTTEELFALQELKQNLHADCDWLLEHFKERKTARENEIEGLNKAKHVLKGSSRSSAAGAASASFLQVK